MPWLSCHLACSRFAAVSYRCPGGRRWAGGLLASVAPRECCCFILQSCATCIANIAMVCSSKGGYWGILKSTIIIGSSVCLRRAQVLISTAMVHVYTCTEYTSFSHLIIHRPVVNILSRGV